MRAPEDAGIEAISDSYRRAVAGQGFVTLVVYLLCAAAVAIFLVWATRRLRQDAAAARERDEKEIARHNEQLRPFLEKSQKREWVRVPVHVPVKTSPVPRGSRAPPSRRPPPSARPPIGEPPANEVDHTKDISGGGVAYCTLHPPAIGTALDVEIHLEDHFMLRMRGVVARVEDPPAPDEKSIVAVRLTGIEPKVREQLARWVAREQQQIILIDKRKKSGVCLRCGLGLAGTEDPARVLCKRCYGERQLVDGLAHKLPR